MATTINYQVPTVSNTGQCTRQIETIIENSIIQMTAQSATVLYNRVDLEMLPDSPYDAFHEPVPILHEPGGIIVKVKPKAKHYQNSVCIFLCMNEKM